MLITSCSGCLNIADLVSENARAKRLTWRVQGNRQPGAFARRSTLRNMVVIDNSDGSDGHFERRHVSTGQSEQAVCSNHVGRGAACRGFRHDGITCTS